MKGKVVIITGAGRGLGKALAIGLSKAGFVVVATGRNLVDLKKLEPRLMGNYTIQKCDITNWNDCQKLVEKTMTTYGRIDVLINNAGGAYVKTPLLESTKDDIDSVFDTQIKGTTYITKAVLAQMAKQRSGKIFTITHLGYRLGIDLNEQRSLKTLHLASLFGKAAIADLVALESANYGVDSIPVFVRWIASELDIDDKVDPNRKANHPAEVVNTIVANIMSKKEVKEIFIKPHGE